jgi:hypothetical protein
MTELGDTEIVEITLTILKEYLMKQADRLKPSSLGHRIRHTCVCKLLDNGASLDFIKVC